MPGPSPTPTNVLAARGAWRAKGRKGEPQVRVSAPDCPAWVQGYGRQWWPEIAGQLAEMGVMGEPFSMPLGLLVDAMGQYLEAKKHVEESGLTLTSEKGSVYTNPAVWIMTNAWDRALKAAIQFGLTPSAKARLTVGEGEKEPKDDGKRRFFKLG